MSARHFDGVLVAHQLRTDSTELEVPGVITREPLERYNPWTRGYYTVYHEIEQPGYTATERIVRCRLDVWSPGERSQLVWSGTTRTINPASGEDVSRQIAGLIVPALRRDG